MKFSDDKDLSHVKDILKEWVLDGKMTKPTNHLH